MMLFQQHSARLCC